MIKKISLPNHKAKSNCTRKTIGCLYQFANIKTEFKEFKDRENAQRCLYWFTLTQSYIQSSQKLMRNSTKQSNLDHLQHNQESYLDPFKTHTSVGQHTNTKNVDLDPLKNTQHFSANTQRFLFNKYKDYTCYISKSEINTSRNPISFTLINLNL